MEHHRAGRLDQAAACYRRVLAAEPDQDDALYLLGVIAHQQGRFDEATVAYRGAVARHPEFADAHYNLGQVLRTTGALTEAEAGFRRARELDPTHAGAGEALCDLKEASGDAAQAEGRIDDAVAAYRAALALDPSRPRVWYAAGCAENARGRHVAAIACFRRALQITPDWPEAQHNLAQALFNLGAIDEALALFRRAATGRQPELPRAMIAVLIPGSPSSDNQAILDARRTFADLDLPPSRPAGRFGPRAQRLRVGYLSAFFHRHNWMKPVWGLIDQHDRRRLEIHLFSDAPASAIRHGYRPHPDDRFHDVSALSAEGVADAIENARIDVLVDLNGYSSVRRLPVVALKPAPVLVGWFNMFATTGLASYDCLIGDAETTRPEEEQFYRERIVRVPGSYLTFDVTYPVPDVVPPPCLTTGAITFGCFAPQYKITSQVIATWCRILRDAPTSSLILKSAALERDDERRFVHDQFAQAGIAPTRVRLDGPADHHAFLGAYDAIDIALDTFPYNGGTTTTEAIWQGVPVVTFRGDRWVARTSASILRAATLGQFVTDDIAAYASLAISLANASDTPAMLAELRHTMRGHLRDSPVCDTAGFARHMERVYHELMGAADSGFDGGMSPP